jgi:type VI secretion system secreted protein Hcp
MWKTILSLAIAGMFLWTATAQAAMMAYMTVKGQKSGQIKGSITQKGREDSIGIIAFDQATQVVLGAKGVGGALKVGAITVTKELDKSSPILRNAMDTQENLTEVYIRFWTPQIKAGTGVGSEVQHYTVRLTNAKILSIRTQMQNIRHPDLQKYDISEVLTFSYEKAEYIWNNGGISAMEFGGALQ